MTRSTRQTVIINDQQSVKPSNTILPGNKILIIGQSSKRPADERPQSGTIDKILSDDLFGAISVSPTDLASSSVSDDQKISIAKALDRNITWNLSNLQNLFPSNSIPNVSVISVGNYTTATLMIKEDTSGYGFNLPTGTDGLSNNAIEFYAVNPGDESNYFQISFSEATDETPRQLGIKYVAPVVGLTGTVNVINDSNIETAYYFDIEDMRIDEIVTNFNSTSNPFSTYVRAEIKYVNSYFTQDNITTDDTTIILEDKYRLQSVSKVTLTTPYTNVAFADAANFSLETNVRTPLDSDSERVNPLINAKLRYNHELSTDVDFKVPLEYDTSVLSGTEPKESGYYSVAVNVPSSYYRDKLTPIVLRSDAGLDLIYGDGGTTPLDSDLFTFYSLGNDEDGYTTNKIQVARSVIDGLGVYKPDDYFAMQMSFKGTVLNPATPTDPEVDPEESNPINDYGVESVNITGLFDNVALVFGYTAMVNGVESTKYITKGVDLTYASVASNIDKITISAKESGGHYGVSSRITKLGLVSKLSSSGKLALVTSIDLPEFAAIFDDVAIDLTTITDISLLEDKYQSTNDATILAVDTLSLGLEIVPKMRYITSTTSPMTSWNQYMVSGSTIKFGASIPTNATLYCDLKYIHTLKSNSEYNVISDGSYEDDYITLGLNPNASSTFTSIWSILNDTPPVDGSVESLLTVEYEQVPSLMAFDENERWYKLSGGTEETEIDDTTYLNQVVEALSEYAVEIEPSMIYLCGVSLDMYSEVIDPTTGDITKTPIEPIKTLGPLIDGLNTMFVTSLFINTKNHYLFDDYARGKRAVVKEYMESHMAYSSTDEFNAVRLRSEYSSPNIRFCAGLLYYVDTTVINSKVITYRVPLSTALVSLRNSIINDFNHAKNAQDYLKLPSLIVSEIVGEGYYKYFQTFGFEVYSRCIVDGADKILCISPVTGINQIDDTAQGRYWQMNDDGIKQAIMIAQQYVKRNVLGKSGITDQQIEAFKLEIVRLIKAAFSTSNFLISISVDITFANDYEMLQGIATLTLDAVFAPTIYQVNTIASLKISKS